MKEGVREFKHASRAACIRTCALQIITFHHCTDCLTLPACILMLAAYPTFLILMEF
jgi:hypothetical protein